MAEAASEAPSCSSPDGRLSADRGACSTNSRCLLTSIDPQTAHRKHCHRETGSQNKGCSEGRRGFIRGRAGLGMSGEVGRMGLAVVLLLSILASSASAAQQGSGRRSLGIPPAPVQVSVSYSTEYPTQLPHRSLFGGSIASQPHCCTAGCK